MERKLNSHTSHNENDNNAFYDNKLNILKPTGYVMHQPV
jgi:hypothetical protein